MREDKEKISIEEKVLFLSNNAIEKWRKKFDEIEIEIEPISISRSGTDKDYFSEIEFNFWKNNNLESVFSIIIFMEGEIDINIEHFEERINKEFMTSFNECK